MRTISQLPLTNWIIQVWSLQHVSDTVKKSRQKIASYWCFWRTLHTNVSYLQCSYLGDGIICHTIPLQLKFGRLIYHMTLFNLFTPKSDQLQFSLQSLTRDIIQYGYLFAQMKVDWSIISHYMVGRICIMSLGWKVLMSQAMSMTIWTETSLPRQLAWSHLAC